MNPSWWVVMSTTVSGALALFFLLRSARRPRCRWLCAGHGLMAVAMAVMSSPWGALVPAAVGAGVFTATALGSGLHAMGRWRRGAGGEVQFCVGSAVMAFMYLSQLLGPAPSGHHHGAGAAGAVEVVPLTIALVFAGCLVFHAGRSLTVLAVRPGAVLAQRVSAAPPPELAAGAVMSGLMASMLVIGVA
jgi:hypothetical protein